MNRQSTTDANENATQFLYAVSTFYFLIKYSLQVNVAGAVFHNFISEKCAANYSKSMFYKLLKMVRIFYSDHNSW